MSGNIICVHCGKKIKPHPRVKNQTYCGESICQKARRAKWYREKIVGDPDYRDNQIRCRKEWLRKNPDYYKRYRAAHPQYVKRNKLLQAKRNAKNRDDRLGRLIANIDALATQDNSRFFSTGKLFKLIPQAQKSIANIDALTVKLVPI